MSPALKYIQHVWDNVSRKSWQRLNSAMRRSLSTAIEAGMSFSEGDFVYMSRELRAGRWWSENLEWAYSLACGSERGSENPSAVHSIEHYLKREPFLWAEKTKTPERLHVGARFTWKGEFVTVTSFNDKAKSLTACTYKQQGRDYNDKLKVGDISYFGCDHHIIEAMVRYDDGRTVVRYSPPVEDQTRDIARRFTVTLEELQTVRKDYDSRRRAHEKAIKAATTLGALDAAQQAAGDEGRTAYRHFDIEILSALIAERREQIEGGLKEDEAKRYEAERKRTQAANLERWIAGEDVDNYLGSDVVRIRVKDGFVETSTGHRVSLDAARLTLAFVKRHRSKGWEQNGQHFDVDAFQLQSVSDRGVQIGCTLIPWSEVDRCDSLLKKQPARKAKELQTA